MKISISYNFKDKGAVEDNTATILLEDISVAHMKRVLRELSNMSVNDFARLGAVSTYSAPDSTEADMRNVESFLKGCCSSEDSAK